MEELQGLDVFLVGELSDKCKAILTQLAAKIHSYMNETVSVAISNRQPTEETVEECSEIRDIYDRPAVTEDWLIRSHQANSILTKTPFLVGEARLFDSKVFCLNMITKLDADRLWIMITYHGGKCLRRWNSDVTHMICGRNCGSKLLNMSPDTRVVTPDWVTTSIKAKQCVPENQYHPSLLICTPQQPATPKSEPGLQSALRKQLQAPPQPLPQAMSSAMSVSGSFLTHQPTTPNVAGYHPNVSHAKNLAYSPAISSNYGVTGDARQQMAVTRMPYHSPMPPTPSSSYQPINNPSSSAIMNPMNYRTAPATSNIVSMRHQPPPSTMGFPMQRSSHGMSMHRPMISQHHEMDRTTPMSYPMSQSPSQHHSSPPQPQIMHPSHIMVSQHSQISYLQHPSAASQMTQQHIPGSICHTPGQRPTSTSPRGTPQRGTTPPQMNLGRMTEVPCPSHATLPEETPIIKMTNMAAFPMGQVEMSRKKSPITASEPLPHPPTPKRPHKQSLSPAKAESEIPKTKKPVASVPSSSEPAVKESTTKSTCKPPAVVPSSADIMYYGYDNNETVPRDMCLVGCIFYMGDYAKSTTHSVDQWIKVIEAHGGTVDPSYSNRVTHVLVETQASDVCTLALNDNKRVITAHWLNDVVGQGRMDPPWRAHHLPHPHTHDRPVCGSQVICTTGFNTVENRILREMVRMIGASFTTYLAETNTVLICKRPIGEKVIKAAEWKIPLVNVKWLSDLLLGNTRALKLPIDPKYKLFNPQTEFIIDPSYATNIMGGWKVPLKIPKDCWRKFKPNTKASDSALDSKRKADEDMMGSSSKRFRLQEIQNTRSNLNPGQVPHVMLTGFSEQERNGLADMIRNFGGVICEHAKTCTHLISEKICRTPNFLRAINYCTFITSPEWISESLKCGHFVDERIFTLQNSEVGSMWNILEALERRNLKGAPFKGMKFYITPGVPQTTHLPMSLLTELIECAGGSVLKLEKGQKRWSSRKILESRRAQPNNRPSLIVITCKDDVHLCYDLVVKNIEIYNVEFILSSIMNQQPSFDANRLIVETHPPES